MSARLRRIWKGIKGRCQGSASAGLNYRSRGVTVCNDWQAFDKFMEWAVAAGYTDNRSIDRIDADGPYNPANCRWISPALNSARQGMPRDGAYVAQLTGALTDEAIASLAPARATKVTDGAGLYLAARPRGGRSWRFKYTWGGRERLLTFGSYPELSIAEAREMRAIAKARIARGVNPATVRDQSRARAARRARAKASTD